MTTRARLEPIRLMVFAEVVYWAVAGLLSTPSREAVADDRALERIADRLTRGLVDRLRRHGVSMAEFATIFFSRFAADAALRTSIRAGHFVNFVLRAGWIADGRVVLPEGLAVADDEAGRLLRRLADQDFSAEERLAARLGASAGVFVQIGANDLATVDDRPYRRIYRSAGWRKVLVEPTAGAFAELERAAAAFPETTLVRGAIDDRPGVRRLATEGSVQETRQATFSKVLARTRGLGRLEAVRCLDGPGLAAEAGIDRIDVLVVDTEGHDRVVLDQILRITEPDAIVIEWAHAGLADAVAMVETFQARGYDWCWPLISLDFVAIKRGS